MKKKFEGKTLLELGSSVGAVEIVNYSKKNGAKVIVTDYYDESRSPAKKIADISLDVSTTDVDALVNICQEYSVDGIMSGVSEINIETSRKVAEKVGLPIYYTSTLWDKFMNKNNFREMCKKYGVTTPKTYFMGDPSHLNSIDKFVYPVIIKPADASSNAGISICETPLELLNSINHAVENSKSKSIIIEQFVDGLEISCTYVIKEKECSLVCMGTKYPYINEKGLKALSNAYIYPSTYLPEYLADENDRVKNMIVKEEVDNCTLFVQGIYNQGKFYLFEAGLRMEGTGSYRLTNHINGVSFLEFMVDNAFGVESSYDLSKEDPSFHGKKCVIFSQIVKGGKIVSTKGYELFKNNPLIISSEQRRYPGDYIEPDGTLKQIMYRYIISADSLTEVVSLIYEIQKKVVALDENGENILMTEFDPKILLGKV